MTGKAFVFNGIEMRARTDGALFVPGWSTVVVADLHLEKGSEFAKRGTPLPPYDSRATLASLARCLHRLRPRRVICLGDSFHDGDGSRRMARDDYLSLQRLVEGRDWMWITGNHDRLATDFAGGRIATEISIGPFVFRHEAELDAANGEISGHFHPKASIKVRGRRVSGRCFVMDSRRLILPSFGAYTGGLDVFHPAVRDLVEPVFQVHLIGSERVHSVSSAALDGNRPDNGRYGLR